MRAGDGSGLGEQAVWSFKASALGIEKGAKAKLPLSEGHKTLKPRKERGLQMYQERRTMLPQ